MRERNWLSFQSGEIRVCASCHGINTQSQTGAPEPTNPPTALQNLLAEWRTQHPAAPIARGDCNADLAINAADMSGLVLEIFDGDGVNPLVAPAGPYVGDALGCDANADATVNAGDLACLARLIFGSGPCGS